MDTNVNLAQNLPPVRAQKKHIVLFVIACVLLTVAVLSTVVLMTAVIAPPQVEDPTGDPLATGAALFVGMGYVVVMAILRILFYVSCLIGVIMAAVLVSSRNNKPRWMWVAALCMTGGSVLMGAVMMLCL